MFWTVVISFVQAWTVVHCDITIHQPPKQNYSLQNPIPENTVTGITEVYNCTATDSGNGRVFYTVTITPQDGKFTFDYLTCVLSTIANPMFDFEKTPEYKVEVSAKNGNASDTQIRTFYVPIENINERPRFRNLPTTIKVNENAGPQRIFTFAVDDPDNSTFTYHIVAASPPGSEAKFELEKYGVAGLNQIWLVKSPGLNYEKQIDFNLSIIANDSLLTSTPAYIHIELRDINEAPVFRDSNATATIYEESPIGTTLVTSIAPIRALDPDILANDTVTYILEGKYANYFDIETINQEAVITVAKRMDREDLRVPIDGAFVLRVSALDRKKLRQNVRNTFNITVTPIDVNDHPTICSPIIYQGTIKENSVIDTSILTVSCTDSDDTTRYPITYSINTTGLPDQYFYFPSLGQSTVLSSKYPLDLKCGTLFKFVVDVAQGALLNSFTTTVNELS